MMHDEGGCPGEVGSSASPGPFLRPGSRRDEIVKEEQSDPRHPRESLMVLALGRPDDFIIAATHGKIIRKIFCQAIC